MKLVDELEAEWAAELELLEAEIKQLKQTLKICAERDLLQMKEIERLRAELERIVELGNGVPQGFSNTVKQATIARKALK